MRQIRRISTKLLYYYLTIGKISLSKRNIWRYYKMMKKIKKQVLACRLEIHWWLIMWYRKRMTKLFSCGEPLSSPRMLQLNNKAGRHHVFIMKNEKLFEDLYLSWNTDSLCRRRRSLESTPSFGPKCTSAYWKKCEFPIEEPIALIGHDGFCEGL